MQFVIAAIDSVMLSEQYKCTICPIGWSPLSYKPIAAQYWRGRVCKILNFSRKTHFFVKQPVLRHSFKTLFHIPWPTGINKRIYRVFITYCVFSLKCCDLSGLCQFCCSAGVLPAWFVYTHWHQGKTEKDQSPEYSEIFGKNTIFNEHPVVGNS